MSSSSMEVHTGFQTVSFPSGITCIAFFQNPYTPELHKLTTRTSLYFFLNICLPMIKTRHSHTELKSLHGHAIHTVEDKS